MKPAELKAVQTELERGMRVFKAFESALKTIEALQNATQVGQELEAANNLLRAEGEKLAAENDVARGNLEKTRKEVADVVAIGKEKAKAVVDKAAADAHNLRADADAYADRLGRQAEATASIMNEVNAKRDALQQEVLELEQKLAAAKEAAAKLLGV